jgi:ribosomal protein L29
MKRLRKLEVFFEQRMMFTGDEREAQRVAEQLGFDVEVVLLPVETTDRFAEARRTIARVLRKKKWTVERIARAMNCSPRTANRWLAI